MGELIVDFIFGLAGVVLLWQQNQIFREQNRIFAAQSNKTRSKIDSNAGQPATSFKRYWPSVGIACLMILTWAGAAYNYYERNYGYGYDPTRVWKDGKPLERIYNQTYRNMTVQLDNKFFVNSTFDNVTFYYAGIGPFGFDGYHFITHPGVPIILASKNRVVTQTMAIEDMMKTTQGCHDLIENRGPNFDIGIPTK